MTVGVTTSVARDSETCAGVPVPRAGRPGPAGPGTVGQPEGNLKRSESAESIMNCLELPSSFRAAAGPGKAIQGRPADSGGARPHGDHHVIRDQAHRHWQLPGTVTELPPRPRPGQCAAHSFKFSGYMIEERFKFRVNLNLLRRASVQ